jgi:LysM repeat protein
MTMGLLVVCASPVRAEASPPNEPGVYDELPAPNGADASSLRGLPAPTDEVEAVPVLTSLSPPPESTTGAEPQPPPSPDPAPSGGPDPSSKPAVPEEEPQAKPASKPKAKSKRTWVRHEVIPGDRLDTIADRYGVKRSSIQKWNKLDRKKSVIRVGQRLKIYARYTPPPRKQITYTVKKGDTWPGIAKKYGVDQDILRRWNRKVPRKFKYGTKLRIWVEQKNSSSSRRGKKKGSSSTPLNVKNVSTKGYSIGKPNRGRLVSGVQLPENDELYERRRPEGLFGTSHTIGNLQRAVAVWRRDSGYRGKLVISAISKKSGGKFRPHSSHQTGRDVDIRLPVRGGVDHSLAQNSAEVDWDATWGLVEALIETNQVQYIFLEASRQKRLYAAAKRAGVKRSSLKKWIQYPNKAKTNNGIVRHAKGHTSHIHVRFNCGPTEARCLSY